MMNGHRILAKDYMEMKKKNMINSFKMLYYFFNETMS